MWRRQPDVDGVAHVVIAETQAQIDGLATAAGALDRDRTGFHSSADVLRARPKGGFEAAFPGEGGDHAAAGGVGQEA